MLYSKLSYFFNTHFSNMVKQIIYRKENGQRPKFEKCFLRSGGERGGVSPLMVNASRFYRLDGYPFEGN